MYYHNQGKQLSTKKEDEMKTNLSDAEWKIMELLWEKEPRTMMDITKALADDTGWSKHTVMTYLKRMEEKGALHFEEGERAKQYYADLNREEVIVKETEHFLSKVFKGKMGLMLNTMVEQNAITEEEIQELYDILEKGKNND